MDSAVYRPAGIRATKRASILIRLSPPPVDFLLFAEDAEQLREVQEYARRLLRRPHRGRRVADSRQLSLALDDLTDTTTTTRNVELHVA